MGVQMTLAKPTGLNKVQVKQRLAGLLCSKPVAFLSIDAPLGDRAIRSDIRIQGVTSLTGSPTHDSRLGRHIALLPDYPCTNHISPH